MKIFQGVELKSQGVRSNYSLDFWAEPGSLAEVAVHLGMKEKYNMKKKYVDPLLGESLSMTEPDSPDSPTRKYVATKNR